MNVGESALLGELLLLGCQGRADVGLGHAKGIGAGRVRVTGPLSSVS